MLNKKGNKKFLSSSVG